ncbi:MAG: RNA polymerase sigma factor region1.1 domain-containing protein, partial [Betaproteobacteria bacterium]|nr:RNA polymerase sigma factor region1.1 domain-containing protein [Betaproteobacteria bacterium]
MTKASSKTQTPTPRGASRKETSVVEVSPAEVRPVVDAPRGKVHRVAAKEGGAAEVNAVKAATKSAASVTSPAPKRGRPPKAGVVTAEADTSAARRGRKSKAEEPTDDLSDDLSEEVEAVEVDAEVAEVEVVEEVAAAPVPKTRKASRAREKQLLKEFGYDDSNITDEELGRRRARLKSLIKMGKTRGFLTYGEINDHIPDNLADPELMETIVSMLNDVGIAVYETTP